MLNLLQLLILTLTAVLVHFQLQLLSVQLVLPLMSMLVQPVHYAEQTAKINYAQQTEQENAILNLAKINLD